MHKFLDQYPTNVDVTFVLKIICHTTLVGHKDENIGIDGNIEGKKYGNIGGNIGEISISIKL